MSTYNTAGRSPLGRLRRRYETTDTKCPACGFVLTDGNWTSRTDGRRVVYHHVRPSCDADRGHVIELGE